MKHRMLAVYDRKVLAFNRPFFAPTVGSGLRSFGHEVNREGPDNVMNDHPEDFCLYDLGEYDDSDGSFYLVNPPGVVCEAIAVFIEPE